MQKQEQSHSSTCKQEQQQEEPDRQDSEVAAQKPTTGFGGLDLAWQLDI